MAQAGTENINFKLKIHTQYLKDQSKPASNQYTFAYTITISNEGNKAAKLLSRHWIISDSNGKTEQVKGPGVVGKFPYLRPGEAFEYTSGATIKTPVGSMQGSYKMQTEDGLNFNLPIPAFSLTAHSEIILH